MRDAPQLKSLAGMKERFRPGTKAWIASDSPVSSFSGVFEDDGRTGYFYAYDPGRKSTPILDAVRTTFQIGIWGLKPKSFGRGMASRRVS